MSQIQIDVLNKYQFMVYYLHNIKSFKEKSITHDDFIAVSMHFDTFHIQTSCTLNLKAFRLLHLCLKNFNLGHCFCTIRDKDSFFGMHTYKTLMRNNFQKWLPGAQRCSH